MNHLFQAFGQKGLLDIGGKPEFRIRKAKEDGGRRLSKTFPFRYTCLSSPSALKSNYGMEVFLECPAFPSSPMRVSSAKSSLGQSGRYAVADTLRVPSAVDESSSLS